MEGAFYFDLASPHSYLVAERILHVLPGPIEWRPVLAAGLADPQPPQESISACHQQDQVVMPTRDQQDRVLREEIEGEAALQGLQPLRWPVRFPFDSEPAMLAATYARTIGRTVPFALAAFRQAFAGGHPLDDLDFVLIAAAACEMHPRAVLKNIDLRSTSERLATATGLAAREGVDRVPSIRIGESLFSGPHALAEAALAAR